MDAIQKSMLEKIADLHEVPEGAYNIRSNGALAGRNTTANIDIVTKQDKSDRFRTPCRLPLSLFCKKFPPYS